MSAELAVHDLFYITPIIYAEISAGFERIAELENALPAEYFQQDDLPYEAAFLAGKCFSKFAGQEGKDVRPCRIFT